VSTHLPVTQLDRHRQVKRIANVPTFPPLRGGRSLLFGKATLKPGSQPGDGGAFGTGKGTIIGTIICY
jgi:hypothetical protein